MNQASNESRVLEDNLFLETKLDGYFSTQPRYCRTCKFFKLVGMSRIKNSIAQDYKSYNSIDFVALPSLRKRSN